jgi:alpha-ketoglutarate-dependent taurine dioxygenase
MAGFDPAIPAVGAWHRQVSPRRNVMTAQLSTHALGEALGTEIAGVDLARLDDRDFAAIEEIFREHPVLVFRGQRLGAAELAAFGARFGTPHPHILENYRHPDHPDVSFITNVAKDGSIAILHAVEVPREKGGTMFADMYRAYDALPPAMKDRLAALTGRHGYTDGPDARKIYEPEHIRERNAGRCEQLHPAVKEHPVTGRKVLFVNPTHCHGFVGMSDDEAIPLIEELRDHATQDRFVYYHPWRVGDVVIWDEIATMHRGAADAAPEARRIMLRTIVHPS